MINLELLDSCENCPKFIAKGEYVGDMAIGFNIEPIHKVTCENIEICRALLDHLKKEEKKNGRKEK